MNRSLAPAATAPTVAAPIAPIATTIVAAGARSRFADAQRTAAHLRAVQGVNRLVGFRFVGHIHKAEALGATSLSVHDHGGFRNPPMLREQLFEFLRAARVGQISDVNLQIVLLDRRAFLLPRSTALLHNAKHAPYALVAQYAIAFCGSCRLPGIPADARGRANP